MVLWFFIVVVYIPAKSQVSVYRTIGPLDFTSVDTFNEFFRNKSLNTKVSFFCPLDSVVNSFKLEFNSELLNQILRSKSKRALVMP